MKANIETPDIDIEIKVAQGEGVCPHYDMLGTSKQLIKCQDCRDALMSSGEVIKGASVVTLESKDIWICLDCGHLSCAIAGSTSSRNSHAGRHAIQFGHQQAIRSENQLLWCFNCDMIVPTGKSGDGVEQREVKTFEGNKPGNSAVVVSSGGNEVVKEKEICQHFDKGVDLKKLRAELCSLESPVNCEDCKKSMRQAKNGGAESRSESKVLWLCLKCARVVCGGSGSPITGSTHVTAHAKTFGHQLAILCKNPQFIWCFGCQMLIPTEKLEDNQQKHVKSAIVKMVTGFGSNMQNVAENLENNSDQKDVLDEAVKMVNVQQFENPAAVGSGERGYYSIRPFQNTGNTCYVNSVLQNLLALDRLREYYYNMESSVGPLSDAFKKLVVHMESSPRQVVHPKSLLRQVYTRFTKGIQQDSHELLNFILHGLSEELKSSQEYVNSDPTIVDSIFGGHFLSTTTCLNCTHSSYTSEAFLDVSLFIPTKKFLFKFDNHDRSIFRLDKPSLERCLSLYTGEELISWRCEKCSKVCQENIGSDKGTESKSKGSEHEEAKEIKNAMKRSLIYHASPILIIHLQRFIQNRDGSVQKKDGSSHVRDASIQVKDGPGQNKDGAIQYKHGQLAWKKLEGRVIFKDTLNLKPYMHPRSVLYLNWLRTNYLC